MIHKGKKSENKIKKTYQRTKSIYFDKLHQIINSKYKQ